MAVGSAVHQFGVRHRRDRAVVAGGDDQGGLADLGGAVRYGEQVGDEAAPGAHHRGQAGQGGPLGRGQARQDLAGGQDGQVTQQQAQPQGRRELDQRS
ncbi:hypothetical protein ACFSTC_19285 [Nonomuraea ferruginea]